MNCKTCKFFDAKAQDKGLCRAKAPGLPGWPQVKETDWCGDYTAAASA